MFLMILSQSSDLNMDITRWKDEALMIPIKELLTTKARKWFDKRQNAGQKFGNHGQISTHSKRGRSLLIVWISEDPNNCDGQRPVQNHLQDRENE